MISHPDRIEALELIDEAVSCGARRAPACEALGICERTYRRWKGDNETANTDKRTEALRPEPENKLSPEERKAILAVCHEPDFADLPPTQIVPALADQGCYLASESSFYRVMHEADPVRTRLQDLARCGRGM